MKRLNLLLWSVAAIIALTAVSCSDDKAAAPAISTFGFYSSDNSALDTDYPATISGTEISVTLPGLVDKSSLVARFSTKNSDDLVRVGSTAQTSGVTPNNFSSAVMYTAVNSDESKSVVYTVTVSSAAVAAPKLLTFGFYREDNPEDLYEDYEATVGDGTVTVALPATVDKSALKARFTTNAGDVAKVGDVTLTSGVTALDYSNPVDITLTNFDGKLNAVYSVTLSRKSATFTSPVRVSTDSTYSAILKVNPANNQPYIAYRVWGDKSDATRERKLNVITLNGDNWENVGGKDVDVAVSDYLQIDFDAAGTPYVAYQDNAKSPKGATVLKYSGGSWSALASESLQTSLEKAVSAYVSFGVISENDIILTQVNSSRYSSFARNSYVVSKFDGSAWSSAYHNTFGSATSYISTATSSSDAVYTMVLSRTSPRKYTLSKYQNGTWTDLRALYLPEGSTTVYATIQIFALRANDEGDLWVLTGDDALTNNTWQIRVDKYTASTGTWSTVGGTPLPTPLMGARTPSTAAFAIAPDGTPYIALVENGSKDIKIVTINPETLQWSDAQTVTTGYDDNLSIDFSSTGIMYISYKDEDGRINVVQGR